MRLSEGLILLVDGDGGCWIGATDTATGSGMQLTTHSGTNMRAPAMVLPALPLLHDAASAGTVAMKYGYDSQSSLPLLC